VKVAKPISLIPALKETRPLQLLHAPVSRPGLTTLRAYLPPADRNQAILINPPGKVVSTVFYFPGCGSERMFSDISKATIFLLLCQGHQVVLPPPYMCCGYPLKVNARKKEAQKVSLENTIIMTQIRDMFNDLEFSGCIVSCGTCMESLSDQGITDLFDARLFDISGYLFEHGLTAATPQACLYHAPCHDSLKGMAVAKLAQAGIEARDVPYCCSEAGTMALSRPDISYNMFLRKQDAIKTARQGLGTVKPRILTNCPSCVQGLGRQNQVTAVHMAVELAQLTGGADWMKQFRALIRNMEIVTF
jgi:Fe-S oxidoreductase